MHPTDAQLDAYIARSLDGRARRDIDDHLESCLSCTLRLEFAAAQPERWERRGPLRRLVPRIPSRALANAQV